jgi:hypothetical protein
LKPIVTEKIGRCAFVKVVDWTRYWPVQDVIARVLDVKRIDAPGEPGAAFQMFIVAPVNGEVGGNGYVEVE